MDTNELKEYFRMKAGKGDCRRLVEVGNNTLFQAIDTMERLQREMDQAEASDYRNSKLLIKARSDRNEAQHRIVELEQERDQANQIRDDFMNERDMALALVKDLTPA